MERRLSRRTLLRASGVSGIGLLLAACGSDNDTSDVTPSIGSSVGDSNPSPTSSVASPPPTSSNTKESPTASESSAAGTGGEVVIGLLEEPSGNITNLWRRNLQGIQVGNNLFETLTRIHDYSTMTLEPHLAVEWDQEDDVTYVFKLREGVQFHGGYGEMTAEDAAWSINTGIEEGGGSRSYTASAKARDKYTLEVKLQQPFSGFLTSWSHTWYGSIHCKAAFDELGQEEYMRRGIGTGPFQLEEWNPGVSLSLVRFDDYWDPERPKLERLTFLPVADPVVKLERLRAGELDLIDSIPYRELERVREDADLIVMTPPGDEWDYMAFNLRLPDDHPLRSPLVRQVIGYAINRNEIVDLVYHGNATAADHPFIEGLPGHSPDFNFFPLGGDQEKARELLEQAGFSNGFEVTCITSSKPELRSQIELVAGQLSEVGITISIQALDDATFSERERQTHDFEMSLEDISMAGPDSDASVYWFLHSEHDTYSGYNNPEVDRLLDEGRSEDDPKTRHVIYQQLFTDHIHQDVPMLYTAQPNQIWLMNSKLEGFRPSRTEFDIYLDEMHWKP